MHSGPSKSAEAIVSVLVPAASRDEVVGDLHERYRSPGQYALEALRTIPLVIFSRIRRTVDPQVLLIQAFCWFAPFLSAAWIEDRAFLGKPWGLVQLAVPAALAVLGLILDDAYAKPGRRSPLNLARGPLLGLGLALGSQGVFRLTTPDLAVPSWITFYGCGPALLLSSTVRMLFPPITGELRGVNVPANWLKQSGAPGNSRGIRVLKGAAAIMAILAAGTWVADRAALPKPPVVTLLLILSVAYQVWKRG
jgi:hypothetical protein